MRINANQLIPIIFPPGAGGHFFFNLLTIHPDVMPMGKDQCMKKLFEDENLDDSVARIKLTVPKDHSMWQDIESHDYYIAPPRFDDPNDSANWIVEDDSITTEGDDYFLNKVNKYWYRYGVVVHNVEQFPLLHKIKKQIGFDRFTKHVENSTNKIKNVTYDYSTWDIERDNHNLLIIDSDEFYYDWDKAGPWIQFSFEFLNLKITKEGMDAIKQLWHHYLSVHSID